MFRDTYRHGCSHRDIGRMEKGLSAPAWVIYIGARNGGTGHNHPAGRPEDMLTKMYYDVVREQQKRSGQNKQH